MAFAGLAFAGSAFAGSAFAGSAFAGSAFASSSCFCTQRSTNCLLRGVFIRIENAFFLCYVVAMYQVAKLQCLDYRHCRIHRNCKPNVSVARGGAACARSHAYSAVTAGPSWANGKSRCTLRVLLTEKHGLLYFHEISEAHYCQNFHVLAMNYEVAATNFQR